MLEVFEAYMSNHRPYFSTDHSNDFGNNDFSPKHNPYPVEENQFYMDPSYDSRPLYVNLMKQDEIPHENHLDKNKTKSPKMNIYGFTNLEPRNNLDDRLMSGRPQDGLIRDDSRHDDIYDNLNMGSLQPSYDGSINRKQKHFLIQHFPEQYDDNYKYHMYDKSYRDDKISGGYGKVRVNFGGYEKVSVDVGGYEKVGNNNSGFGKMDSEYEKDTINNSGYGKTNCVRSTLDQPEKIIEYGKSKEDGSNEKKTKGEPINPSKNLSLSPHSSFQSVISYNGSLPISDQPIILESGPGAHQIKDYNFQPVNVIRVNYTPKSSDVLFIRLICDPRMNRVDPKVFILALSPMFNVSNNKCIFLHNLKISKDMLRGRTKGFKFQLEYCLLVDNKEVYKIRSKDFFIWSNVNQNGFPRRLREEYVNESENINKKRKREIEEE